MLFCFSQTERAVKGEKTWKMRGQTDFTTKRRAIIRTIGAVTGKCRELTRPFFVALEFHCDKPAQRVCVYVERAGAERRREQRDLKKQPPRAPTHVPRHAFAARSRRFPLPLSALTWEAAARLGNTKTPTSWLCLKTHLTMTQCCRGASHRGLMSKYI